jgi:dihydrofolate reductase
MSIEIALIAAVAENGVIGNGPDIPWCLPSDFAHFKRTTLGKPLIMGRKTFESIGKPLPGRTNIIVTRQKGYQPDGVIVIDSLEAAISHAKTIAEADGVDEVMVAGGAEIYRQAMDMADKLYISHVALTPEGDAHFPSINLEIWRVAEEMPVTPSEKDSASYKIALYTRR